MIKPAPHRSFNYTLEALRSVAAIVVVIYHLVYVERWVDPSFQPSGIAAYNAPGHFAVLLFFVLSGYVIGLNHPQALTLPEVRHYLRKRFMRIYPMYVVALLAGFAASGFAYSWATMGWHLVFGINNLPVPNIMENGPIWSLQFEVLFYLLFIPFSMLRAQPWVVALCSMVLAFGCLVADPVGVGRTAFYYLFGFGIWSLGWALAARRTASTGPIRFTKLVSAILLFLSIEVFNVLTTLGQRILSLASNYSMGLVDVSAWKIATHLPSPIDLMAVPFAILIVGQFLHFRGRTWSLFSTLLQWLPLYTFTYLLAHRNAPEAGKYVIPTLCYLGSIILFHWPVNGTVESACQKVVQRLVPVGAISYGLYIVHFPIMAVFHRVYAFSGTPMTFTLRVMLILIFTVGAAYWLEKKFQPWARQLLSRRRAVPVVS
ncbi:MAG: acyltransferase family protein [Janthinobacterium lividum]